ncbi:MAG TPA: MFS transporter [Steroidobacteraceae bacterium]|nr:MFS transporter [Steroidobacteraceae bacterium]
MQADLAHPPRDATRDRAWIFGLLIAPSAVTANGLIQGGVLGYLLSVQHISSGTQSHLIGLLSLPTSLYFLWSPITDFFVRRRTWLLAGGLLAAVFMVVAFQQPHLSSFAALSLMLISVCCSQLVVSSCGGMMGALHSQQTRRIAGSIYQAGSTGFGALAAWVLIYLSSRVSQSMLGWVAGALIGVPTLAAFAAPRQGQLAVESFQATMGRVWGEFKTTFLHWRALPYIACMTFPMASGAAVGLLPGVARQYGVDGDHVAWINGLLGGVMMAAGSAAMSLLKTRMQVPLLYMTVALVNCACAAVLWLGPASPGTYYSGVLLYLFTVGSCYAMFTAVVLEFLGDSGKSGSGRYSIINSLGNIPVLYMLQVDGWGADRWGGRGLAAAEAVVGGAGALLLLIYFLYRGRARAPSVEVQLGG